MDTFLELNINLIISFVLIHKMIYIYVMINKFCKMLKKLSI